MALFRPPPQYQTRNEWTCQPVEGKKDTLRAINSSYFKNNLIGFTSLEFRHEPTNNLLALKTNNQTKIFRFQEKKVENNVSNDQKIRYIFENEGDKTQIELIRGAKDAQFELVFVGGQRFSFLKM